MDDLGIENSLSRTMDETLSPDVRPGRVQCFYGKGNDVIVVSNHINAGGATLLGCDQLNFIHFYHIFKLNFMVK